MPRQKRFILARELGRIPQLIRIRVRNPDGSSLPEMIVRMMLSEEAGCLESQFQRVCRPRRDT